MDDCDGAEASVTLQDLPEAMLLRIIQDLTKPSDICNLGGTCRFLQAVCSSEPVWQPRCQNLETGISNLDQWRTHMDSYRALFRFLWRSCELLGLWSLLDTERFRPWGDNVQGGFIIGLWGFLSVVVCYINNQNDRETWSPLFELFSLSNGTTALVYPHQKRQFILPAVLIPPASDGTIFIDIVTTKVLDDLQKGLVDQDRKDQEGMEWTSGCKEDKLNEELARFGHECKPPVGLFCIDIACDGLQAECLSHLRAAVRSLPPHCKAVVLHPGPLQARPSRWRLCMHRLDKSRNAGRFAGLWVGKYGRPREVNPRGPFGPSHRESVQMLYLHYRESGKLNGTKVLGEYSLPLQESFFAVECEDPDSPGRSPHGLDLAKWLWKEADGSSPEITGWFAGEGATHGYGFRYPGHLPGMLVAESTGDLAFMWSEGEDTRGLEQGANRTSATLRLQRVVNYRDVLLSIERMDLSVNHLIPFG